VVRERIAGGEPDKLGKPLRGVLAGCRRIRTGDVRIVYRINGTEIVLVLCIGARRDDEVYEAAYKRV
jgi:mRNA interferase RelE/StbE